MELKYDLDGDFEYVSPGLIEMSEEQIVDHCHRFSFDMEKARDRFQTLKPSELVLTVHLYLDHVITRAIEESVREPSALKVDRIAFAQKTEFAEALSAVSPELWPAIRTINGLRNKLAHRLNFEINEQMALDIANCSPKKVQEIFKNSKRSKQGALFDILLAVLSFAEFSRQISMSARLIIERNDLRARDKATVVQSKQPRNGNRDGPPLAG